MINYVNNSFDKVLKPCDAQQFMTLTQSEQTEKLILGHRAGEKNSKAKLPALTYMGVLDEAKYKEYLKKCEAQGTKPLGSRRAEFMRPTGLLMLDFDHVGSGVSRDGVTLSNAKSLAESQAKSQREILHSVQNDRNAIDSPVKLWEYIQKGLSAMPEKPLHRGRGWGGSPEGGPGAIALAHITPSGDGLRVVVKRTKGMSIEQEQYEFCKAMKLDAVGIKPDAACKDISRLSFVPMKKEILYYNPSLMFGALPEASDYPDGSLWGGDPLRATLGNEVRWPKGKATPPSQSDTPSINRGGVGEAPTHPEGMQPTNCPSVYRGTSTECGGSSKQSAEQNFPDNYNGISYDELIKRLEEQLGGRPEHGARNSFIFSMACNLRYICNDDAAWIAQILPTYGEDPQKQRATIQSAVNRPMSRTMPETMSRAIRIAKLGAEVDKSEIRNHKSELPPAMPSALPELMELLTSRTPDKMRAAVAMSVFPPLGAHLQDVKFTYWDGRDYEPSFMNVLAAPLSAGKSAVNIPIDYLIADIEARDEVAREKEAAWKERCATLKTTEDKPARPKGLSVQVLSSDMTNAAFVQRLSDAEGKFLYTQMDEIELLNGLKANGSSDVVSAILRLAFDCGKYGQERVASNAINAKVRVRWNWNASTTIQRVRKYFAKNIADGTLSRLSFATIIKDEDDWGEQRPKFAQYGQPFADALQPYIDRLCTCSGTLVCPEAIAWAEQMCDEQVAYAREIDDRTYAQFSFRSVLMGFYRAMLLYIAHGMQWSGEIAEFAAWSVRYDMWCKMRFFSDMMHKDMEEERSAVQRGPVSLLALLPQEFTKQQVQEVRVAQGMSPNPKNMLNSWKQRGYIVLDHERGVYMKCK